MSGKINTKLPFELPAEGESQSEKCSTILPCEGQQFDISCEHLKSMEKIYVCKIPKFQYLLALYEMEKENARKQGRLSSFPKTFACWRPEGSQFDEETASILRGLLQRALKFKEYILESKEHLHNYHYISN